MVLASSPPMVATTPRCSPVDSVRTGDREVDTLRTLKSAENGCGTLEVETLLKKTQLAIHTTDPESSCMYHVEKTPSQSGTKSCKRPGRVARTASGDLRPGRWPRVTGPHVKGQQAAFLFRSCEWTDDAVASRLRIEDNICAGQGGRDADHDDLHCVRERGQSAFFGGTTKGRLRDYWSVRCLSLIHI